MSTHSAFRVPSNIDLAPEEYQTHSRDASRSVTFSPHQLAHLETVFPEMVHVESHSDAQIRHRIGQRSVLAHIRSKVGQ